MNPNLKEPVIHGTKDYPVAIYDIQKIRTSFHVSLHWHEEMEIVYVYSGPLYLTIGKQNYIGKAGDVFIINSKEIHEMHVEDGNVRYGTILFPPASLLFFENDEATRKYLQPLCLGEIMFAHTAYDPSLSQKLFTIIMEILRLNKEKVPAYRFGTKALLLQIIFLLFNEHMEVEHILSQKNTTLNRDILTFINERYTTDISLSEIADTFHMSYKYFSRYFKNNFQTTLSDYIMKLRLERAELLLSTGTLPVTEIAMQTGFNNLSFFIRVFKKAYGYTPLKYRNRLNNL